MAAAREIRYMRRDCINAVEAFIKKVDALPYARVETKGRYYANTNKFTEPSGNSAGARLGIVLGGGDRDVTTYAFRMRDLSSKDNVRPASLRYVPDSGKPAVIVARSFAEGTVNQAEQLDGSRITSDMARTMNSISFGPMFQGWNDTVREGSAEERALAAVLDAYKKEGSWSAALPALKGPDPLLAMEAWAAMSSARDGKVDPDGRGPAATASRGMGLDALYECLEEISGRIGSDKDYEPDLSEYLDPDTDRGRSALRGVACLSAYKEARDHGGVHAKDEAGKTVIGIDMENPLTKAVYDSLAFVRFRSEQKRREIDAAEASRDGLAPVRCVQSTFAGIGRDSDRPPECGVDNALRYRFYRTAMLGEDPDMRSGAPAFTLSLRNGVGSEGLRNLSANDIIVQSGSLNTSRDMQPFGTFLERAMAEPDGHEAFFLKSFPAIADRLSRPGGNGDLEQMVVARMQGAGGKPLDGLSLEIELFTSGKGSARLSEAAGPGGLTGKALEEMFVSNFVSTHTKTPQLSRCLDDAREFPNFSRGVSKFGRCVLADLEDAGVLEHPDQSVRENGTDNPARTARAFRRADRERGAAATRYIMLEGAGIGPGTMADVAAVVGSHGATGAFNRHVALCEAAGASAKEAGDQAGEKRASMMNNDFIVLSDCYGILRDTDLDALSQDVQAAYSGNLQDGALYRPKDRGEKAALAEIYRKGGADFASARVPARFQGGRDGFLLAAWNGIGQDDKLKEKAVASLKAYALDMDTLDDRTYDNLAGRLAGPARSEKALDMERQNAAGAVEPSGPQAETGDEFDYPDE